MSDYPAAGGGKLQSEMQRVQVFLGPRGWRLAPTRTVLGAAKATSNSHWAESVDVEVCIDGEGAECYYYIQDLLEGICSFILGVEYDSESLVRFGLYRERDGVLALLPLDALLTDCLATFPIGTRLVLREHGFAKRVAAYMRPTSARVHTELMFREALFRLQHGHFRASQVIHAGELLALAYLGATSDVELVLPQYAAGVLYSFSSEFDPGALCGRAGLPAVLSQALGSYGELYPRLCSDYQGRRNLFVQTSQRLFDSLWAADFFYADRVHASWPLTQGTSISQKERDEKSSKNSAAPFHSDNRRMGNIELTSNFVYGYPASDDIASPTSVLWFAINLGGIHICTVSREVINIKLSEIESWTSSADGGVLAFALSEERMLHLSGILNRGAEAAVTLLSLYITAVQASASSPNGLRIIFNELHGAPISTTCRADIRVCASSPTVDEPSYTSITHDPLMAQSKESSRAYEGCAYKQSCSCPRSQLNTMCCSCGFHHTTQFPSSGDGCHFNTPNTSYCKRRTQPCIPQHDSCSSHHREAGGCYHNSGMGTQTRLFSETSEDCVSPSHRHGSRRSAGNLDMLAKARTALIRMFLRSKRFKVLNFYFCRWKEIFQTEIKQEESGASLQKHLLRSKAITRIYVVVQAIQFRFIRRAWGLWLAFVASELAMDPILRRSRLLGAWSSWKVYMWFRRYRWRSIAVAWDCWTLNVRVRKQLRRLSQGRNRYCLRDSFDIWYKHAKINTASHTLQDVVSRVWSRISLQRGFDRWKQFIMVLMLEQSSALVALEQFVSQYSLRKAWDRFKEAYIASNAAIFMRLVHQVITRNRLQSSLSRWKKFIMIRNMEVSYAISTITDIFVHYEHDTLHTKLNKAFTLWRRWAGLTALQSAIGNTLSHHQMRRGIEGWKRFVVTRNVECSYALVLITEAFTALLKRTKTYALSQAFDAWKNQMQGQYLGDVVTRITIRHAFEAWKRYDMLRTIEYTWAIDRIVDFFRQHSEHDVLRVALARWRQMVLYLGSPMTNKSRAPSLELEETKSDNSSVSSFASFASARSRGTVANLSHHVQDQRISQLGSKGKELWDLRLRLARCQQSITELEHECHTDLNIARKAMLG